MVIFMSCGMPARQEPQTILRLARRVVINRTGMDTHASEHEGKSCPVGRSEISAAHPPLEQCDTLSLARLLAYRGLSGPSMMA